MKIRNGFVSNSSSSSFIVNKVHLSDFQVWLIKNHIEAAKTLPGLGQSYLEAWEIEETDSSITGHTTMTNFDMGQFMRNIGVPMNFVEFGEYWEDAED